MARANCKHRLSQSTPEWMRDGLQKFLFYLVVFFSDLEVLTVQPFYPPNRRERECEAISARPPTMCLAGEDGRCRGAGRLEEAGRGGGEAEIRFGEMKLAGILVAPITVPFALGRIWGRDGQLGRDLVERMLGRRQAELALEKRGLGRIPVRIGNV